MRHPRASGGWYRRRIPPMESPPAEGPHAFQQVQTQQGLTPLKLDLDVAGGELIEEGEHALNRVFSPVKSAGLFRRARHLTIGAAQIAPKRRDQDHIPELPAHGLSGGPPVGEAGVGEIHVPCVRMTTLSKEGLVVGIQRICRVAIQESLGGLEEPSGIIREKEAAVRLPKSKRPHLHFRTTPKRERLILRVSSYIFSR